MPPPYQFSIYIGSTCARQPRPQASRMRNFFELAGKLNMPVDEVARQCNGRAAPTRALVSGLAKDGY